MSGTEQVLSLDPKQIASKLFSENPDEKLSKQLLLDTVENVTDIYEILVTILMEGIDIVTGGVENINMDVLNSTHLLELNPWFQSIGFTITIDVVNKNDYIDNKHYCKVILRDHGYKPLFELKNIVEKYHFLGNPEYSECEDMKDVYSIFIRNNDVFKIYFNHYFGS